MRMLFQKGLDNECYLPSPDLFLPFKKKRKKICYVRQPVKHQLVNDISHSQEGTQWNVDAVKNEMMIQKTG